MTDRDVVAAAGEAIESAHEDGAIVHVHHYDIEKHAEHYNEGFADAVAQGLADDPTKAQEWLARDRARERAEALEEARAEMRRMMDGFPQRGRHTRATWALNWLDNIIARIRSDAGIGGGGNG